MLIDDWRVLEASYEVLTGKQRNGGALLQLAQSSRGVGQDEIFYPRWSNGFEGVGDCLCGL